MWPGANRGGPTARHNSINGTARHNSINGTAGHDSINGSATIQCVCTCCTCISQSVYSTSASKEREFTTHDWLMAAGKEQCGTPDGDVNDDRVWPAQTMVVQPLEEELVSQRCVEVTFES